MHETQEAKVFISKTPQYHITSKFYIYNAKSCSIHLLSHCGKEQRGHCTEHLLFLSSIESQSREFGIVRGSVNINSFIQGGATPSNAQDSNVYTM